MLDQICIHEEEALFSTTSHAENLAPFRAIVEAKFHADPSDTNVPGSAILARVANRLRDVIVEEEVRRDGSSAAKRWRDWASITQDRPEWLTALEFARGAWGDKWDAWSTDERVFGAACLLSPFEPGPALVEEFLKEAAVAIGGRA